MKQALIVAQSTDTAFELHTILVPRFTRWSSAERLLPMEKVSPSMLANALSSQLCVGIAAEAPEAGQSSKRIIRIIGGMAAFRILTWLVQQGHPVTVNLLLVQPRQAELDDGALDRLVNELADAEFGAQLIGMIWSPPGAAALSLFSQLSEKTRNAIFGRPRASAGNVSQLTGKPRHAFVIRRKSDADGSILSRLLQSRGA
jgi:hypothetical protein